MIAEFKTGRWQRKPVPDYTNQLDLFANLGLSSAESVAGEATNKNQGGLMNDKSRLRDQIMNHWLTHRPQMVKELLRKNQLRESLHETAERTADLLFELVSVQKMKYAEAWEIAIQEWAFLPTEDHLLQPSSTNLSQNPQDLPPAISESTTPIK